MTHETFPELSVPEMLHRARSLIVNDEESFCEITKIYKASKELEKEVEKQRKEANAPDQGRINERNDKAKKLIDPLKEVQTVCKMRLDVYARNLEEQKKEEEAKLLKAADILDLPIPAPKPSGSLRGDGALVSFAWETKFEVTGLELLPLEYWKPDEALIEKHIKLGVSEIPGVRIWTEKVTKVRTR